MTTIEKWIVVVVLCLVGLGGYELQQEHDARIKAETTAAAAQKTIDDAKKDAAIVQQNLAARLSALEAQKQLPATAPQIVIDAQKLFPSLPQPLQVVTPPPTQTTVNGKTEELPSAPVVQIPAADFQTLQAGAIKCEEDDAKLTACSLTAADTQQQLKATHTQADAWKTAAKGGTWLHRTLVAGKWIVVGAGVGFAAGHKW
jgi:hypothetical protein